MVEGFTLWLRIKGGKDFHGNYRMILKTKKLHKVEVEMLRGSRMIWKTEKLLEEVKMLLLDLLEENSNP